MTAKPAENFTWKAGRPLPQIKAHSDRKLEVIERYLDIYFDTVVRDPRMDSLNITLVDAFCGGGIYNGPNGVRYGSPLAILRAVQSAAARLNLNRRKPIRIDAVYHFGDANRLHIDFLREILDRSEFKALLGSKVHLHNSSFTALLPSLIQEIRTRQTKGRAIFVLDQFGYSDVPMATIRQIFKTLPKAEIILTFSIDALLNYLETNKSPSEVVAQFGVTPEFLRLWVGWKNDERIGRALAQRALMSQIHGFSGARFFTPFMIFSEGDGRQMMVAHMSQSQAARDKMLTVHWQAKNTFKHLDKGSMYELGYDARLDIGKRMFCFEESDRENMNKELLEELPRQIFSLTGGGPITLVELLHAIGNRTAATNLDVTGRLQILSEQREIEVIKPLGGQKRPGAAIKDGDQLRLSRQQSFRL